jgi:hypothetical protein
MPLTYEQQIIDGAISDDLRNRVWKYLLNSKWATMWKPVGRALYTEYVPAVQTDYAYWLASTKTTPNTQQHRAAFASDEESLKKHPVLFELWNAINAQFDNQFEIAGHPEGLPHKPDDPSWAPPTPANPNLSAGWRVYASAQTDENSKRTHGVHRDSPFVDDDSYWTILFCANPEWYPTWFADCIFYPDDVEGLTGDHQQLQNADGFQNQNRNFNVGWPDKVVSPVPGRIIAYDGRSLHTTHPAAQWATAQRRVVAFRVRKKISG